MHLILFSSLYQVSFQVNSTNQYNNYNNSKINNSDRLAISDHHPSNLPNNASTTDTKSDKSELMGPKLTNSSFKIEKVVDGVKRPTGIAFLGKDDFLITEKDTGTVKRFTNGTLSNETLVDFNVANYNERGLLSVAISKNNPENKTYVFFYLTESLNADGEDKCGEFSLCDPQRNYLGNRIYRYELKDNSLIDPKLLLDIIPGIYAAHVGGKIVISQDNNLYIGIGDGVIKELITTNIGKGAHPYGTGGIIRLTLNGSAVTPTIFGDEYPYYLYYAYGIRNTFGMNFDPVTGNLWDTENGDGQGDEINLVESGFNSGYRKVMGNREVTSYVGGNISFNPANLTKLNGIGEYSRPELATDRFTICPTDLIFLNSTKYGEDFKNDMFVATFNQNGTLYHFDLTNNRTELLLNKNSTIENQTAPNLVDLQPYSFGKDFGGISSLEVSPDGYLYIVSIQQGAIYKIVPVENNI
jgi:glucose/arabinose dehydrogenase